MYNKLETFSRDPGYFNAVAVLGHPISTNLPRISTTNVTIPGSNQQQTGRILRPLPLETKVVVQDSISKRWDIHGTVTHTSGRNYQVCLQNGRQLWRNRRHLRPSAGSSIADTEEELQEDPKSSSMKKSRGRPRGSKNRKVSFDPNSQPRRSSRVQDRDAADHEG